MNLEIRATGVDDAGRKIDLLADRSRDPRPAFSTITDRLVLAERRLFSSRRGWAPLKRDTIARKERDPRASVRANATTPLVATGFLREYLTTRGYRAQPYKFNRFEMRFGIPGGRHPLYYGRMQARHDRNPVVNRSIVRRAARPVIRDFLLGK